ncbi:MAG: helix-turn-helix transcriptional regulator, partial [Dethiobacteria bacterium]|nr:helix-turn-helix transcriptional regulator [Dethiobacteria bacterium]
TDLAQTLSNALNLSDQEFLEEFFRKGGLTAREIGIVKLLLQGYSNKQIADTLFISEDTLKTHLRNIYRKYGVHKKSELLALIATKAFTAN